MVNENQIYFIVLRFEALARDLNIYVIDFFYPFGVSDRQLPYGQYYKYNQKKFGIFRNKIDGGGGVLPSCDQGPHKLKLKKKPSLKKGVSKTHSKMDDPSLELLISDMTVHI